MIKCRITVAGMWGGGSSTIVLLAVGLMARNESLQTPIPDFWATQFVATPAVQQECPASSAVYGKVNETELADPDRAAKYLTELIDRCPEEYEALWRRAIVRKNSGHMYGALIDLELLLAHVEANPNRDWGFGITFDSVERTLHQVKENLGR